MELTRSDLAFECSAEAGGEGIRTREDCFARCRILRVRVCSAEAAERIGKPQGHYVTLECGRIWEMDGEESERVSRALSVELLDMARIVCGKREGGALRVLVAGIGNERITADALGPLTVSHLVVGGTGTEKGRLTAVAPGVSAQTGLETADFLRGIVQIARPDLLVAVDALAARDPARLGTTVQLSDTGIRPGSGIGARNSILGEETLGVPVISLGVPTVVDCATLVHDALRRSGHGALGDEVRAELDGARRFFVSPREIDLLASASSLLLALAIERAFGRSLL